MAAAKLFPQRALVRVVLGVAGLVLALAVGCERPLLPPQPSAEEGSPRQRPAPQRGEGPGGRRQPLAFTPQQELAIGRRASKEIRNEYRDQFLPDDHPHVRRVRAVSGKIAKAAEIRPLQREINLRLRDYRFEWENNVIRDPQVNAFCLPAGKIFMFTGILDVIGKNDDFLATVLSHEIAHALAHHASERVARKQTADSILRSLRYEREQESEADHIGIFLMTFAGYDPEKGAQFWERMREVRGGKGGGFEWLSDHPSDERRIKTMREWAPKARAAKKAFDQGRIAPENE